MVSGQPVVPESLWLRSKHLFLFKTSIILYSILLCAHPRVAWADVAERVLFMSGSGYVTHP